MDTTKTRGWSIAKKIEHYSRSTDDGSGCILWTASPGGGGYGQLWVSGRYRLAHRVVLERKLGRPIADGMEACHSCNNRLCVNPNHLREDTHQSNIAERRHARGERVGGVKLNAEQIPLIRNDSRSERVIARELGVSSNIIGDIKRRNIWKHVP